MNLRKSIGFWAVFLVIVANVSVSNAMIFETINHIRIEGQVLTVKKNEVFVVSERVLFVLEIPIIATISDGDSLIPIKALNVRKGVHINYNAFNKVIEINRKNVSSYKNYPEIVQYTGDLNPPQPAFPLPPDPTLSKKWFVTIKPVRLLWNWADITVGRRLIAQHGEVRFSYANSSKLQPIGATKEDEAIINWFFGYLKDVKSYSGSIRYYLNESGRGGFLGVGASHSSFAYTKKFISKIFAWPALNMPATFDGGLIEIGATGGLEGTSPISTFSLCGVVGKLHYTADGEKLTAKSLNLIPSLNWTIGIIF